MTERARNNLRPKLPINRRIAQVTTPKVDLDVLRLGLDAEEQPTREDHKNDLPTANLCRLPKQKLTNWQKGTLILVSPPFNLGIIPN